MKQEAVQPPVFRLPPSMKIIFTFRLYSASDCGDIINERNGSQAAGKEETEMSGMQESIYGSHLPEMEALMEEMMEEIRRFREAERAKTGIDPVEHCLCRIKDEESMREKCRRKGLAETTESALRDIRDGIGIRVVCPFLSDVYSVREHILGIPGVSVVEEKDYIRNVKSNGYRSLHLILERHGYYMEVQLRTISMDTWAALEHNMKYKRDVKGREELLVGELKRCADELASTDLSMQTIRDMICREAIKPQARGAEQWTRSSGCGVMEERAEK